MIAAVGSLWAYGSHYSPTYTFKYELTVDIDTPDGIRSGSTVIEVTYWREWVMTVVFGPRFPTKINGEALFVDLGSGKNVLLTLTTFDAASSNAASPDYLPVRIYNFPWGDPGASNAMRVAIEQAKSSAPKLVPFEQLTLMVTFRDLQNPRTLERVDPLKLSATFGPGYALKSVVMRPTNAPITEQLEKRIAWLRGVQNKGLDGGYLTHNSNPFMIGPKDLIAKE